MEQQNYITCDPKEGEVIIEDILEDNPASEINLRPPPPPPPLISSPKRSPAPPKPARKFASNGRGSIPKISIKEAKEKENIGNTMSAQFSIKREQLRSLLERKSLAPVQAKCKTLEHQQKPQKQQKPLPPPRATSKLSLPDLPKQFQKPSEFEHFVRPPFRESFQFRHIDSPVRVQRKGGRDIDASLITITNSSRSQNSQNEKKFQSTLPSPEVRMPSPLGRCILRLLYWLLVLGLVLAGVAMTMMINIPVDHPFSLDLFVLPNQLYWLGVVIPIGCHLILYAIFELCPESRMILGWTNLIILVVSVLYDSFVLFHFYLKIKFIIATLLAYCWLLVIISHIIVNHWIYRSFRATCVTLVMNLLYVFVTLGIFFTCQTFLTLSPNVKYSAFTLIASVVYALLYSVFIWCVKRPSEKLSV